MSAALHHVGIRVADADRAARFYRDALGGRLLTLPVPLTGGPAEQVAEGMPGARLRLAIVAFGDAAVELFEFVGPHVPDWARERARGSVPHLALQVEDVPATLARVEAAGGRRVWPAIDRWGDATVIYAADPDGNVVELLDRPVARIAAGLLRWFPDADPGAAG